MCCGTAGVLTSDPLRERSTESLSVCVRSMCVFVSDIFVSWAARSLLARVLLAQW